jgi:hypothetical protein
MRAGLPPSRFGHTFPVSSARIEALTAAYALPFTRLAERGLAKGLRALHQVAQLACNPPARRENRRLTHGGS